MNNKLISTNAKTNIQSDQNGGFGKIPDKFDWLDESAGAGEAQRGRI